MEMGEYFISRRKPAEPPIARWAAEIGLGDKRVPPKEGHGHPLGLERVAPVCEGTFPEIYHLMT